jgi:hypothetical protein
MKGFSSCSTSQGCALEYGPFEQRALNWCQARVMVTCLRGRKGREEIRGLTAAPISLELDVCNTSARPGRGAPATAVRPGDWG